MKIKESIMLEEREVGGSRVCEGRSDEMWKEEGREGGRNCSEGIRKEELTGVCSCILC